MRPYIINKLIPANEVSLIYGAPGVGKTRYLFELCHYFLEGKPLDLGGQSFQVQQLNIGYASYDRSTAAAEELLIAYDLIDKIQWKSFRNIHSPDPYTAEPMPLDRLITQFKGCELIIVDGMGMLMSDPNKYNVVSRFLRYAGTVCELHNFTMLGNLHAGKERTDSKILNPRQKSLGSTAFSGTTECQIYMGQPNQSDPLDPNRIIQWMPHTSGAITQAVAFTKEGRIINTELALEQDNYELLLIQIPTDKPFPRETILELAEKLSISRFQCDAWLKKCVQEGRLTKPEYGCYRRASN